MGYGCGSVGEPLPNMDKVLGSLVLESKTIIGLAFIREAGGVLGMIWWKAPIRYRIKWSLLIG